MLSIGLECWWKRQYQLTGDSHACSNESQQRHTHPGWWSEWQPSCAHRPEGAQPQNAITTLIFMGTSTRGYTQHTGPVAYLPPHTHSSSRPYLSRRLKPASKSLHREGLCRFEAVCLLPWTKSKSSLEKCIMAHLEKHNLRLSAGTRVL